MRLTVMASFTYVLAHQSTAWRLLVKGKFAERHIAKISWRRYRRGNNFEVRRVRYNTALRGGGLNTDIKSNARIGFTAAEVEKSIISQR